MISLLGYCQFTHYPHRCQADLPQYGKNKRFKSLFLSRLLRDLPFTLRPVQWKEGFQCLLAMALFFVEGFDFSSVKE